MLMFRAEVFNKYRNDTVERLIVKCQQVIMERKYLLPTFSTTFEL